MAMTKWTPTTNLKMLRRMGKLIEEIGELSVVASRCIIQGINEVDPGSGRVNRDRLTDEIADVLAQCLVTMDAIELDHMVINDRVIEKEALMYEWEGMFEPEQSTNECSSPNNYRAKPEVIDHVSNMMLIENMIIRYHERAGRFNFQYSHFNLMSWHVGIREQGLSEVDWGRMSIDDYAVQISYTDGSDSHSSYTVLLNDIIEWDLAQGAHDGTDDSLLV